MAAVVLALALGACGEDEPDGPTEEQYAKQVNRICSDNASEIATLYDFVPKKPDAIDIRLFVEGIGPALDVMLLQVRQLDKPEEEAPDVERLISIYERLTTDAKNAAKSDRGSLAFAAGFERRIQLIDEAAESAGAPNCGAQG